MILCGDKMLSKLDREGAGAGILPGGHRVAGGNDGTVQRRIAK